MATTYLNNTNKQNTTGYSAKGVGKLKLGSFAVAKYTSPKTEVMGVNVKLGNLNARPNVGFVSDRAPNQPSGMTVNGVPTYGSGKMNKVTVFPTDRSGPSPETKFTYFSPLKPSGKRFIDLK